MFFFDSASLSFRNKGEWPTHNTVQAITASEFIILINGGIYKIITYINKMDEEY